MLPKVTTALTEASSLHDRKRRDCPVPLEHVMTETSVNSLWFVSFIFDTVLPALTPPAVKS